MARVLAERCLANGYSGRRLYGFARRAGLAELSVEVIPLQVTDPGLWRVLSRWEMASGVAVECGDMTADEVRRLDESWTAMGEEGTFFAITSMVLVAGRKA